MQAEHAVAVALGWPEAPVIAEIHPDDPMAAFVRARVDDEARTVAEYFGAALSVTNLLDQLQAHQQRDWSQLETVLDFGAGFGRVLRLLLPRLGPRRLWAADIMPAANAFLAATFGVSVVPSADAPAAVVLPRRFDLVLANSLFSHLPEATFAGWLARLHGALKPSGLLVFSTHGPGAYQGLRGRPFARDFEFAPVSENTVVAAECYGQTFCSEAFVRAAVGRLEGAVVLAYLPHWLDGFQDVYVVGRPGSLRAGFRPLPGPLGSFDGFVTDGRDHVLAGWALASEGARVRRVDLFGDDRHLGAAELGDPRPDVAARHPGADAGAGFHLRHAFAGRLPGWLVAVFTDQRGARTVRISAAGAAEKRPRR